MKKEMFSDGSASAYAELPVPAAFLSWTRGDAKLSGLLQSDPGLYLGGWRAFVTAQDGSKLPPLPLPVVDRVSEDGQHPYQVYACNYINFLPLQHRTRFELRERVKDNQTGKEFDKVVKISRERRPGYAPYRQVFGLLYSNDLETHAPAVIKIWKWSAFITFEKAGQAWGKVAKTGPDDKALVRRYGTIGVKVESKVVPNFEEFNQGRSTPIEAIGVNKPIFIPVTAEMEKMYEDSLEWKNCERWNAEGKPAEDAPAPEMTVEMAEFNKKCEELGLSNLDADDALKEANGDYKQALANLSADPNAALEAAEDF